MSHDVLAEDASVLSGLTIDDLKGRAVAGCREQKVIAARSGPGAGRAPRADAQDAVADAALGRRTAFSNPNWLFEPKLDGYRVIATLENGEVRLASRRGLDCSAEYPWLVEALRQQPYRDAIFDGEVVALDEQGHPSFQLLQNRGSEPKPHLVYYAFDLLFRDGYDLRGVPLEQRKALLGSSLFPIPGDRVRLVEAFPEHGTTVYDAALANGMEGIVAKRRDSRYDAGKRTDAWLKIKATQSDEFVVGGYTVGSGSRASTFGSLAVGYYKAGASKLTYVGHAGSGFDDRTLQTLHPNAWKALRTDESPFDGEVPGVWHVAPAGQSRGAEHLGADRTWWRRSSTPSGRRTAFCARRSLWGCAKTRRRATWARSRSSRRRLRYVKLSPSAAAPRASPPSSSTNCCTTPARR